MGSTIRIARPCIGLRPCLCVLVSAATFLGGCSTQLTMSVLGGGVSALVTHNINGSVSRTFTAPLPDVRQAAQAALDAMKVPVESSDITDGGETLRARAGDRSIELEFESLGESITVLRATARRPGFLRDNATASEIVRQTEIVMAAAADERMEGVRHVVDDGGGRRAGMPTPAYYVLLLESVPKSSRRSPRPVPAALQEHLIYTSEAEENGRAVVQVNLGFFSAEHDAALVHRTVLKWYPQARVLRLVRRQGEVDASYRRDRDVRLAAYRAN